MEILQIIIPKRMKDQRIDAALSEMIPDYSRSKIAAWIKSGEVLINDKTFKSKDKVNGNETVCLKLYPHDVEIRRQAKRVGTNDESRKEVHKLMNSCKVVCSNCWIKLDNDLIEFL